MNTILFSTKCFDTCFYLTGEQIKTLVNLGCNKVAISTSDMQKYEGHITGVYFLNQTNDAVSEVASIAGYGISNSVTAYQRQWGAAILKHYKLRTLDSIDCVDDNFYLFK